MRVIIVGIRMDQEMALEQVGAAHKCLKYLPYRMT